jgi:hypothetical protein
VTEFSKRAYDQDVVAMSRETFDLEQVQSQAQAPDGKKLFLQPITDSIQKRLRGPLSL